MDGSKTRLTIGVLAAAMLLAGAPVAVAQNSAADTYGGLGGTPVGDVTPEDGNDAATAEAASDGALPFTGYEIGLALGSAVVLVMAGLALSRLVTRRLQT